MDHPLEIEIIEPSKVVAGCACVCASTVPHGLGQLSEQERMEANKASLRAKAAYPDYLFNHL